MLHEKVSLSLPGSEDYAALYTYFTNVSNEIPVGPLPTVIVCPGGGYQFTSDREAEPLALRFNAYGINAVVLRYSVKPAVFPTALLELAKTVEYVKTEGVKYGCDPDRIFTVEFISSDESIATVDEIGMVEAVKVSDEPVTVTVKLHYRGKVYEDTCLVHVIEEND